MSFILRLAPVLVVASTCLACGSSDDSAGPSFDGRAKPVVQNYSKTVFVSYSAAVDDVAKLRDSLDAFVAGPSAATQQAAKDAWIASRPNYLQTEVYRFYGGPIDDENGLEPEINSWPMDENYVDYTVADPTAGIINDPTGFPSIDEATLKSADEVGGSTNVSTGFHAIEFLLWGQDLSDTGPGERPHTDYVTGGTGTAANQDRRGTYLKTLGSLLLKDLTSVRDEWSPDADDYRTTDFEKLPPKEALGLILLGIGWMSNTELPHERMEVSYDSKDQEDEHSCFSDTTVPLDHFNDEVGIENVYFGKFGGEDGPGLDELVRSVDPALDQEMQDDIAAAKAAIQAIPAPYDQSLLGDDSAPGRVAIKTAFDAVYAQGATIQKIADAFGIPLVVTP
jgi:putative iron-regulated protein